MPQRLNSNREPLTRERKQGLAISALAHVLLALLIIIITFKVNIPEPTEEGLLVNFGFDETGDGLFEPAPQPVSPPPPPPSTGDIGAEEAVLTQEFEEAPEVKKKEPSAEELQRQADKRAADAKRREDAEAEKKRIEQETADRLRREAEQKRIDQSNARMQKALGNAGNTGTSGTSEGIAGGAGNQGVKTGTVGAPNYGPGGGPGQGKPSYDLAGRQPQKLPMPEYDYQKEGRVVVEVTVDSEGTVTQARAGVKGTTINDDYFLKVARDAAMKAKFDRKPDAPIQKGTITYNFKLK